MKKLVNGVLVDMTPDEIAAHVAGPTQAEIDAAANAAILRELVTLDLGSIRSIREYIAAKPDAPQILRDKEAAAAAARANLK